MCYNVEVDKRKTRIMNMDYCKLENTLSALKQCADDWQEESNSPCEIKSKKFLIELMAELLNEEGYEINDPSIVEDYPDSREMTI